MSQSKDTQLHNKDDNVITKAFVNSIVAAIVSCAWAWQASAQQFGAGAYMPLVPGTAWVYLSGTGTVVRQVAPSLIPIGGVITTPVQASFGDIDYFTNDQNGLRWHAQLSLSAPGTVVFTPFRFVAATFSVGDSYLSSGTISLNGQPAGTYSGSSFVAGVETITVPAGRFQTIRVQRSISMFFSNGTSGSDNSTFWVAENIGPVQMNFSSNVLGSGFHQLVSSNRLPALASAVLPASRSARVGAPVTAFATIINAGPSNATRCGIQLGSSIAAILNYQTTDPATNIVTGTLNTPVDIAVGQAQSFVVALTPTSPINPSDVQFSFDCENSPASGVLLGINTLLLSASATDTPDVIALAATLSNDGIVNIPGTVGIGAFAVASANVGSSEAITVSADTGSTTLPVTLSLCETVPSTGQCQQPPAGSVSTTINSGGTPTFAVFVQGNSGVAFNPAANRIYLRFRDSTGVVRGATSVAVRTL
jgi:hypothetical protein